MMVRHIGVLRVVVESVRWAAVHVACNLNRKYRVRSRQEPTHQHLLVSTLEALASATRK